jgi:hypothetical protein
MKNKIRTVKVEGFGQFPIDMLRYDRAYPASEKDSGIINETGVRTVQVIMDHEPTIQRWASFCWKVL